MSGMISVLEFATPAVAFAAILVCALLIFSASRKRPDALLNATLSIDLAAGAFAGLELAVVLCGLAADTLPVGRFLHALQYGISLWMIPAFLYYARAIGAGRTSPGFDRVLGNSMTAFLLMASLSTAAAFLFPDLFVLQGAPRQGQSAGSPWAARGEDGPATFFLDLLFTLSGLILLGAVLGAIRKSPRKNDGLHLAGLFLYFWSTAQSFAVVLTGGFFGPLPDLRVSRVALGGVGFGLVSSLAAFRRFAEESAEVYEARARLDRELAERTRIEGELRATQQRMADILEFLPDPTLAVDASGVVIAWNRAAEEMTGVSARDLIGRGGYAHAVPFFGTPRPILIDLALQADPRIEAEYDYVRRVGDTLFAEKRNSLVNGGRGGYLWGIAKPFRDSKGRIAGAIESIRDLSAHKETEDKLEELASGLERKVEERTAELAEKTVKLERTLEELTNARDSLVKAEKLAAVGRLGANIAHELNSPLGAVLSATTGISGRTVRAVRALASELAGLGPDCALLERMIERSSARASEVYSVFPREDRKEIRDSLKASGAPDPETLSEYLSELFTPEEARSLAPELAKLADPIRTLAAVYDLAYVTRSLALANESARKASRVVNTVQSFARSGSGDAAPFDAAEAIEAILVLYFGSLKRNVRLETDWAARDPVLGCRDRLDQVWANLIDNALRAMDYQGTLTLRSRRVGEWIEVDVQDEGLGIPEEIRPRIFEPFCTTRPVGEGTGLGLDVCRRFVEADGGTILYESEPGRTVFTVRLPAADRG